jgi:ADP-ribosyl-[dinitrogen reductase] hydrolase
VAQIDGHHLRHLLLGLAAGDALGSTSEFVPQSEISALYSHVKDEGWPFKQIGGGNSCLNPGDPTDDTEMALCILRSFLEDGSFYPKNIAKEFVAWMRRPLKILELR